jgi:hypothetical protein
MSDTFTQTPATVPVSRRNALFRFAGAALSVTGLK